MNRSILGVIVGVIAIATIGAGVSVSEAAVKALSPPPAPFTQASAYVGADVGIIWTKDPIADLDRLDAIQSHALRDSRVIGGGALGYNFQYRQFACIKVGHRLSC